MAPGADAVHPDALLGVVDGEAAGEVDHRRLARPVDDARRRRRAGPTPTPSTRSCRRRWLGHRRHGVLGAEEHRADVDRHHQVPVLHAEAHGGARADRAGVVEQRVEAAEGVDGGGDHRRHGSCVGHVDLARRRGRRRPRRSAPRSRRPSAQRMSATTTAAPSSAKRSALARPIPEPGTGDDRDLSLQQHRRMVSRRPSGPSSGPGPGPCGGGRCGPSRRAGRAAR